VQSYGGVSPIPSLFGSLESHATDIANHLEGLVKHYDLCGTALRHTEGGGEAMTRISSNLEAGEGSAQLAGLGVELNQFEQAGPPEPMSDEERADMLAVLMKDAAEVDDVVSEIKDRLAEMEDQLSQIASYVDILRKTFTRLQTTLALLREAAGHVPQYISAAAEFQGHWEEEKRHLLEKAEEVEGSTDIFAGFADAYDELLLEVYRRNHFKAKMEKVMDKAMREIDKIYHEDLELRAAFKSNQADYLPSDIWPGLLDPPPKYEFVSVDEQAENLPRIDKSVYEAAYKRNRAKSKPGMRSA
jgi:autophagy-related protein 17